MKSLRKSFLTLLALTLFGGAGAWAQGQLLTTINASSSFTNGTQTFDNIVTVTLDDVSYDANNGWYASGSPRPVEVAPVNGVTVTGYMLYFSETGPMEFEGSSFEVALEGYRVLADDISTQIGSVGITKIEVYGTAPAQAIELTKVGDNQWTLGQTPDYDVELQVVYYDQYTLDSIPLDWQVKVGNAAPVYPTAYTEGNTTLGHLTITETDSVELIPPADVKPNVKNVTLVEPVTVQTVTIGNVTLQVVEGETWEAIVDRNSGVIIKDGSMIMRWSDGWYLIAGGNWVNTSDPYNSTANYSWEAMW